MIQSPIGGPLDQPTEEYADLASMPDIGVEGIMYLALDTGKLYRWDGADYTIVSGDTILSNAQVKAAYEANADTNAFTDAEKTSVASAEQTANKNTANGYAGLDAGGKVDAAQLPSYVDDILEYADFASLPGTGETGKIYVTQDDGKVFRWSGAAYLEISKDEQTAGDVLYDNSASGLTATDTQVALDELAEEKVDVSALASNIIIYPTSVAGDFGYNRAVSDLDDGDYDSPAVDIATGDITGDDQLLAGIISDAGLVVGNPGVITITTIGEIKRVSGNASATFYFELYKRDIGGTETLLATSNVTPAVSSTTYEQFHTTLLLNNGSYLATDRFVLKFYGNDVGNGSNSEFNFQFGGTNPVRTLLPVPASVVTPGAAEIKSLYESNDDTNALTDALLAQIGSGGGGGGGGHTVEAMADGAILEHQAVKFLESKAKAISLSSVGAFDGVATAGSPQDIKISSIGNDKVVGAYRYNSEFYCVVGTLSGDIITWGTESKFTGQAAVYSIDIVGAGDDKFAVAFRGGASNDLYVVAATVSGTTISYGTEAGLSVSYPTVKGVDMIGTDRFAITFISSSKLHTVAFTLSGTTVTLGTEVDLGGYYDMMQDADLIKTGTDAYAITSYGDNAKLMIHGCTVSGTTVTAGSGYEAISSGVGGYVSVTRMSDGNIAFTLPVSGAVNIYTAVVSGTTASGAALVATLDSNAVYAIGKGSEGNAVVLYNDGSKLAVAELNQATFATVKITQTTSNPSNMTDITYTNGYFVGATYDADFGGVNISGFTVRLNESDLAVGIANAAISDANLGDITIFGGACNTFSAVNAGDKYYLQSNGTITTTVTDTQIGVGVASDTVLLYERNEILSNKENSANKSIDPNLGNSDLLFPSQKAVKTYIDNKGTTEKTLTSKSFVEAGDFVQIGSHGGTPYVEKPTVIQGSLLSIPGTNHNGTSIQLSSTKYLYHATDGIFHVVTVDAGETYGAAQTPTFEASAGSYAMCKLDSTRVAVLYKYNDGTASTGIVILSISGDTVTAGTTQVITTAGNSYSNQIKLVGTDKVIMNYAISSNDYAACATISGTTPTVGTGVTMPDAYTNTAYQTIIGTDKVLFHYTAGDMGNEETRAVVGTISGTTITLGSSIQLSSSYQNVEYGISEETDSATIFGSYDFINVTVSGTTITIENVQEHGLGNTINTIEKLDGTYVGVFGTYIGGNTKYFSIEMTKASNSITITGGDHFATVGDMESLSYLTPMEFDEGIHFACYSSSTPQEGELYKVSTAINPLLVDGIVQTAGALNEDVIVVPLGGISRVHTGLTAGDLYYLDETGSLTTTVTNFVMGEAIGSDTIKTVSSNVSVNHNLLSFELDTDVTVGEIVKIINDGGEKAARIISSTIGDIEVNGTEKHYDGSACQIGTDKIVMAFRMQDSNDLECICATISGTTITWGTRAVIVPNYGGYQTPIAIGTDKFAVVYRDSSANTGAARVGTISGTTITFGTIATFNTGAAYWTKAAKLDTDKFAISYEDSADTFTKTVAATVSGSTITFGSETIVNNAGDNQGGGIASMGTNKVMYLYSISGTMYARAATVSGTTFTFGTEIEVGAGNIQNKKIAGTELAADSAIFVYGSSGFRGTAFTADGTTLTAGDEITFTGVNYGDTVSIMRLSDTQAVAQGEYNGPILIPVNISGTSIAKGASIETTPGTFVTYNMAAYAGNNKIVSIFVDTTNNYYMSGIVTTVNEGDVNLVEGISQTAGSAGGYAQIALLGEVSEGHSGLTIGDNYYIQSDGIISTNVKGRYLGKAISTTQINTKEKERLGWKDNIAALSGANAAGLNKADWVVWVGGLYAYSFHPNTEESLHVTFHILHDYKKGTNMYPHVHWSPTTTNTGTVRWGFEYAYANGYGQEAFTTTDTVYVEQAADGVVGSHLIAETADPGVEFPNIDTDALIHVRIFRDATHGNDTYTGEAIGLMCDLHYMSDHELTENRNGPF